jgi:hypothetical protein
MLSFVEDVGPISVETFAKSIDSAWIAEALEATGKASVRRRGFPAELAVFLVIGMALFSDRSIDDVVNHLRLVLPEKKKLARSAIPQGRARVGPEAIKLLFRKASSVWRERLGAKTWRGLSLFAVDGSCLKVQDSDANYEAFGKASGAKGEAGYPQVRVACLLDLSQRMLVDAEFGSYRTSELALAQNLWPQVPAKSVTILDRGFNAYPIIAAVVDESRNRHILIRLRSDVKPELLQELPDASCAAVMRADKPVRAAHPDIRREIRGRVITFQHPDGKLSRLFTTLVDHQEFPAEDLVLLYHQRWEIELAYDEMKVHLLHRKESLRSKTPDGVGQELWGIFLAYNMVRYEMALAAAEFDVDPDRISFQNSMLTVRMFFERSAWIAPPTKLQSRLAEMQHYLVVHLLILPERRFERRFPREVKVTQSRYPRNRRPRTRPKTPSLLN